MDKADEIDKEYNDELDKAKKEREKQNNVAKLWPYNKPIILMVPAIIGAIGVGAVMPVSAIPMAKLLALLSAPMDV